jgi:hypothetical protein
VTITTRAWLAWAGVSTLIGVTADYVLAIVGFRGTDLALVMFGIGLTWSAATPPVLARLARRIRAIDVWRDTHLAGQAELVYADALRLSANLSPAQVEAAGAKISADYKATHDIRDLATLPCRYGCTDPVHCRWPHRGCSHCETTRRAVGAPDA